MSLKKFALVAVVLLAAVISFTIIAPWAADPVNHVSSIEKTQNKISAVMTLSGGAAGTSATLSVLPGDMCTPLAEQLAGTKEKDNRTEAEKELIALRKENAKLRLENEILKKAALIFATKSSS